MRVDVSTLWAHVEVREQQQPGFDSFHYEGPGDWTPVAMVSGWQALLPAHPPFGPS